MKYPRLHLAVNSLTPVGLARNAQAAFQLRRVAMGMSALGIAVALTGCPDHGGEDLEEFCKVVNQVSGDASVTPEKKLATIEGKSAEYTKSGPNGPDGVWQKLAATPLEKRYEVLLEAAKSVGKADYKCSAYQTLLATAVVEQQARERALREPPDAGVAPPPDAGVEPPDAGVVKASKASKRKRKHHR